MPSIYLQTYANQYRNSQISMIAFNTIKTQQINSMQTNQNGQLAKNIYIYKFCIPVSKLTTIIV